MHPFAKLAVHRGAVALEFAGRLFKSMVCRQMIAAGLCGPLRQIALCRGGVVQGLAMPTTLSVTISCTCKRALRDATTLMANARCQNDCDDCDGKHGELCVPPTVLTGCLLPW